MKAKSDIRNALEVLKQATLQVLYQSRCEGPLQLTAIREQLGIPRVSENSDARDNSLVYGILTHLQDDGSVEYLKSPRWQITEEGVSTLRIRSDLRTLIQVVCWISFKEPRLAGYARTTKQPAFMKGGHR